MAVTDTDLTASDVVWDLAPLLPAPDDEGIAHLLDRADAIADELAQARGTVHEFDAERLATFMQGLADVGDLLGRAGSFAGLDFSADRRPRARCPHAARRRTFDPDRDEA